MNIDVTSLIPPGILIHQDSLLSEFEQILRGSIESKIAAHDKNALKALYKYQYYLTQNENLTCYVSGSVASACYSPRGVAWRVVREPSL
ncbi:MAG: hypothetical protein RR887_12890 [Niameybacter sp.]